MKLMECILFKNGKKKPIEKGNIPVYGGNGILGYNDGVIDSDKINLVRTAKTEIVMHPAVAKQICELLASELKNYEDKLEKLNE